MATNTLQEVLPDPNYKRYFDSSSHASGTTGPGFAQVQLENDQRMLTSRTNSQRLLARGIAGQKWKININYNPMTQEEFAPVFAFLLEKQGPLTPFFVSLPQYRTAQSSDWQTLISNTDNVWRTTAQVLAGKSQIVVDGFANGSAVTLNGTTQRPSPGELITFGVDQSNNDLNHKKAYMITTVETPNHDVSSAPNGNSFRLTISPPLVKTVNNDDTVIFNKPLIKVVMPQPFKTYTLNKDNLYSFNLKLEEFL